MQKVANSTEAAQRKLDLIVHQTKIVEAESDDTGNDGSGDHFDAKLTFELIDGSCVLGLGEGEAIVVDIEAAEVELFEGFLTRDGVADVVPTKVDAAIVDGNTSVEHLVLHKVS